MEQLEETAALESAGKLSSGRIRVAVVGERPEVQEAVAMMDPAPVRFCELRWFCHRGEALGWLK